MYFNRNSILKESRVVAVGNTSLSYSFIISRFRFIVFVCTFYLQIAGFFVDSFRIYKNDFGFFVFISAYECSLLKPSFFSREKFLYVLKKVLEIVCCISIPIYLDLKIFPHYIDVLQKTFLIRNVFKGSSDVIHLAYTAIILPTAQSCASFFSYILETTLRHQIIIDFVGFCFEVCFSSVFVEKKLKGYRILFKGRWNGVDRTQCFVFSGGNLTAQKISCDMYFGTSECITPYGVGNIKVWLNY